MRWLREHRQNNRGYVILRKTLGASKIAEREPGDATKGEKWPLRGSCLSKREWEPYYGLKCNCPDHGLKLTLHSTRSNLH